MPISLDQFVENLASTGLMLAEEVSTICDSPEEQRPADAEDLAKLLIREGHLTNYQASAIYRGEHKNLIFHEYIILDRVGAGGMGVVLKAQHRRMKRIVAIKVLPAKSLDSPDAVERFYREVEAAAKLTHPNIAHVTRPRSWQLADDQQRTKKRLTNVANEESSSESKSA